MSEIGDLIYQKRTELGLTLEDVAQAVGVGRSTVRKWEKGMIKSIRSDKLQLLADVLHISPARLIPGNKKKKKPAFSHITAGMIDTQRARAFTSVNHFEVPSRSIADRLESTYGLKQIKVVKVTNSPELESLLKVWNVSSTKAKKAAVEVLKVMRDTEEDK